MEDPTGDQQKPPAMATYVVQSSFDQYIALMRSEQAQRDRELTLKEEALKREKEKSDREYEFEKERVKAEVAAI